MRPGGVESVGLCGNARFGGPHVRPSAPAPITFFAPPVSMPMCGFVTDLFMNRDQLISVDTVAGNTGSAPWNQYTCGMGRTGVNMGAARSPDSGLYLNETPYGSFVGTVWRNYL